MNLIVTALLLGPISAKITWETTHTRYGKDGRRLDDNIQLSFSHNASDCIVAGVDPDHPTTIYIGGPCSGLVNGVPQADFRWVEMQTFDAELVDTNGNPATMVALPGESFSYQVEVEGSHAEAGAGMAVGFDATAHPGMNNAGLFLSTTSYLAKGTFEVTTNEFVVGDTANDRVENVCIVPCTGSSYPVTCSTCPNTPLSVTPGMYKYSILAAAYDGARGGVANGWSKVKAAYGNPLQGYLNVYQGIDFTNMKADTLTIAGPSGSATTYANMSACSMSTWKDVADPSKDCVAYDVASTTVESDGWSGSYAFPLTYNYGTWKQPLANWIATSKISTTIEGTHKVKIQCIKPSDADLASMNMAGKKLILLEYKFDVSGIDAGMTASEALGAYMVYDPTITTKTKGSGSGSGGAGTKDPGTTSAGRIACTPTMALFTMVGMAAGMLM